MVVIAPKPVRKPEAENPSAQAPVETEKPKRNKAPKDATK